jgi:ferredoxin
MTSKRLVLDPIACDAFGHCVDLLPELLVSDEWGYPILAPGTVPPELLSLAEAAVRACPRRALSLRDT